MHKDYTSAKAIRAIAVFEIVKGAIAVLAICGLLALINRDLEDFAEDVVSILRLNPESRYPHLFIETLGSIDNKNIKFFVAIGIVYALIRFVEAYGLWHLKAWAEWFAIISGMIYIPIEIYEIFKKPTAFRFTILICNIGIVLYLLYVRREAVYHKKHPDEPAAVLEH